MSEVLLFLVRSKGYKRGISNLKIPNHKHQAPNNIQ